MAEHFSAFREIKETCKLIKLYINRTIGLDSPLNPNTTWMKQRGPIGSRMQVPNSEPPGPSAS